MATKEFLRALRKKHHLGEFSRKHLGLSKPKRPARTKRKLRRVAKRTGVVRMAKRKRHSSKRGGMLHKGSITSGLIKPSGIIASALLGAGAATLAENLGITNAVPYGKYVAGGLVGGVGGVAGVFARDLVKGQVGTSTSGVTMY